MTPQTKKRTLYGCGGLLLCLLACLLLIGNLSARRLAPGPQTLQTAKEMGYYYGYPETVFSHTFGLPQRVSRTNFDGIDYFHWEYRRPDGEIEVTVNGAFGTIGRITPVGPRLYPFLPR